MHAILGENAGPKHQLLYQYQSMALSASCAGHTRTQSHAALYKINNEVVHSGMVAS